MNEARVLIVEDNEEVAQMLILFLSAKGLKVTIAEDGATALKLVREVLPNLIMLDVGLPDTDGYTLFAKFREISRTRYIPVLFLTRRNQKSDRIAGLQLGADDYITKPFDLEELYLRVQNCVNRALREHLSDPLTGLPSGPITRDEVAQAKTQAGRTALQFQLRHLAEFRDLYGALASADLLRYTALLLNQTLNSLGAPNDFLGQTSEATFVLISATDKMDTIRKTVVGQFEQEAIQHYNLAERHGALVQATTAQGAKHTVPLICLDTQPL
jgi:DNA-binding response OmpR family regulator